jgi:hypothetical protein
MCGSVRLLDIQANDKTTMPDNKDNSKNKKYWENREETRLD